MSDSLRYADVSALLRLVREAGELRDRPEERRRHLMTGLLGIVGGDTAGLVDFPRAPAAGTPGTNVVLVGFSSDEAREAAAIYGSAQGSLVNPALPAIAARARAGPAAARREELLADREWYAADYVAEVRARWRIDHVMYATQVSERGAVGFSFARACGRRRFADEDRNLVQLFAEHFTDLLRDDEPELHARRRALSPRARETLDRLLRGESSKEIAAALELSVHTVNQYVKSVFRRFRVGSRAELIAAWYRGR
ncbi:MAG: helix-turn-helix transcriptional regulator [Nannocystaceae bacterium]